MTIIMDIGGEGYMSSFVECKACKHHVSPEASVCPRCGERSPGTNKAKNSYLIAIILVLFLSMGIGMFILVKWLLF